MPSKLLMWLHDPAHRKRLRTLQVTFVVLVLVAIGGAAILATVALDNLDPPIVERQSEIRSPDSRWLAVTYRINRTGALGGFNYEVRIAHPRNATEEGSLVWDSYMVHPVTVRWTTNSTIDVEAADDDSEGDGTVHDGRSHGITARTVVAQNGHLVPFREAKP